jgi:two-component system phosphate regulon response regulator OmpR
MTAKPRMPLADDAPHVLVVDDDRRLRELLSRFLGEHGYRVTTARDAVEARISIGHFIFDCLILDVMMPGENGFELASFLASRIDAPILMLTARMDADDRVHGLEIGVADYLGKPFEPRELLLRLQNILRRNAAMTPNPTPERDTVRFGMYTFHKDRGELSHGDTVIRITDRERDMLGVLATSPGEVVPREALAKRGETSNERTVDVQINRLRRKIESDPANPLHLQTVRGVGYRLVAT